MMNLNERECQNFNGGLNNAGYGQLNHAGFRKAHRLAYELGVGHIPDGMGVLHHCDNPACINTEHLWLGTPQDNMTDKTLKGRHRNGGKLTKEQVADIRSRQYSYTYRSQVAREFKVSPSCITRILQGKAY